MEKAQLKSLKNVSFGWYFKRIRNKKDKETVNLTISSMFKEKRRRRMEDNRIIECIERAHYILSNLMAVKPGEESPDCH